MTIQKEFVLRYRDNEHVRFQIPPRACEKKIAQLLTEQILAIKGVYSVHLYRSQNKLSIRFHSSICTFSELAKQLFQILTELESQGWFESQKQLVLPKPGRSKLKQRLKSTRISRWFGEKYQAAKETFQAVKIVGKLTTKGPRALIRDPEKATIDFLNDILVLYLIKAHWTRITQEWLVRPFVYRYEWLATFYMFFLLVRSRRKK
ncbi:hypothetical protein [Methylomonas sp. AM2-LC]|uniref:hypothetical protein n=1 Tax=Methylomonas sp. AM2-LC TaxID=3153301 RepID=UPI003266B748